MADTAAHLVDRVLPQVPVRQWVLSLPYTLRYHMAYDARLTSEILQIFVRRIFSSLRHRAKVVPKRDTESPVPSPEAKPIETETAKPDRHPRNYSWAELLHRVFALDVLACPECGGRMRMLSAVHSPEAIRAILECLGLPARSPPVSPADPGDSLFDPFEAC
jgi:hypothetical protein